MVWTMTAKFSYFGYKTLGALAKENFAWAYKVKDLIFCYFKDRKIKGIQIGLAKTSFKKITL